MPQTPRFVRSDLPRRPDGLPGAYGRGLSEIWERCSPAYEQQAITLLDALAARGFVGELVLAGSEDGEVLVVRKDDGEFALLFTLEEPDEAVRIKKAIADGTLDRLLNDVLHV